MYFRNYLPVEKGVTLCFNKLESQSPKDALLQVWKKLTQEKEMKICKVYRKQADGRSDSQTDDGQQAIRKAHLSFQLR